MPAANTAVDAASGEQTSPSRGVNPKALFVTGLSLDAEFVDLHKHFDRFGTIVLCRVLKDAKTGISRGIGYVNFDSEEEAAAAQKATDGFPGPRDESALSVKFAEADPTYRAVATTKVFVRYVPVDFTTAQVAEVFSKYGKVTEVVIDADRSRAVKKGPTPWNYAYVQFTTTGEANKAIANGAREVQWSSRPITVKPAEGEETRQLRCGKSNASVAVSSASSTTSSATVPAQLATASTTRSNTPVKDVDSCTPSKPEPAFLTLAQSTSIDEAFATALPTPVPSVPAKGVTAVAAQPEFVFQSQPDVNSGGFVTAMPTYYAAPQGMPFILAPGTAGGYFAAAPQPLQYVQFVPHPFAPHGAPTAPTVACGAPTWMSYAPVQQQSSFGVAPWASHDGMMMPTFAAPSY